MIPALAQVRAGISAVPMSIYIGDPKYYGKLERRIALILDASFMKPIRAEEVVVSELIQAVRQFDGGKSQPFKRPTGHAEGEGQ